MVSFSWDTGDSCFQAPLGLGRCHVTVLTHGLVGVTSGLRLVRTYMPPPVLPSPVSAAVETTGQDGKARM